VQVQRTIQLAIALVFVTAPAWTQLPHPQLDSQWQAALALEQQGKAAEAEVAWRACLKAHPANPEPLAHLGLLEARQEHYPQAVEFYRKALALNPGLPGLRLNLGLALFKQGLLKEAIPEFHQLLQTTPPNSPEAQRLTILLGMARYGAGQYGLAVPLLRQAAAQDPQNLPLRLALAHSCLWSRQYQCVLETCRQIVLLNPESAEADMLAGEASDEMHDRGGAVQQFRAAVKANPKEPNARFALGYLLWKQRQFPEAATELQAELDNDPAHLQAMLYLGDTLLQLDRPDQARPLLEKALQLDSSLWLAHLDLGILEANADRKEEALRQMQLAASLKPGEVDIHWRLGRLYRSMGRTGEATIELDKAKSLNKASDESVKQKLSGSNPASPAVLGAGSP
jgi:tetratricopeptide (TPR) repeat protein